MTIRIRPGRSGDHVRLLEVWRAAVEPSHGFLEPEDVDWYEAIVAGHLRHMTDLRVAVDHTGAILGFLAQDAGEIHMLFVAPVAQRRGVGTALLEEVASQFGVVRLDVNEQNPSARAFYTANGFEEVGRSDTDGQGRSFPLLHLRREHPQSARPVASSSSSVLGKPRLGLPPVGGTSV